MSGGRKEEGDPVSEMAGQEEVIYGVQRVDSSHGEGLLLWRGVQERRTNHSDLSLTRYS